MRVRRQLPIAKFCRSRMAAGRVEAAAARPAAAAEASPAVSVFPSPRRLSPSVLSHVPSLLPVVRPPRSRLASPSRFLSTAITPLRLGTSPRRILHRRFRCLRRNAWGPDLKPSLSSSPDAHASQVHSHRFVATSLRPSRSQMDCGSIFAVPAFFELCLDVFVTESSGSSTSLRLVLFSVKLLTLCKMSA